MMHTRKTCSDLWGQSSILKPIHDNCRWLGRGQAITIIFDRM